jgi:hypothetical protein
MELVMLHSFEEFKTAVLSSLQDKIAERISQERESLSNSLLRGENVDSDEIDTESSTKEN